MIAIVYNGGAYGTYLEWVLTTLTTDIPIHAPFTSVGNSHNFSKNYFSTEGNPFLDKTVQGRWNKFLNNKTIVNLHPKFSKYEKLSTKLNSIVDSVKYGIYLYPDRNSVLLNVNNFYTKIWNDWWEERLTDPVFYNNLFDNFPISKDTEISDIPVWIKREILSFNLMPSWVDQVEWYHPDTWTHSRCQLVLINELLYDFKNTILKLQNFCNLDFKKSVDDIIPYHIKMLSLQKWLTQDQLCKKIIDSITLNQVFDWSDQELPLPSQSWIQWQLRNLGYEIQCHGLDIFPTNTTQLVDLLTTQNTNAIINNNSKD